jgi:hypothetical protein
MTEQFHLFGEELNSPDPSKSDGPASNSNSSLFYYDEIVPGVIFSQATDNLCRFPRSTWVEWQRNEIVLQYRL